MVRRVRGWTLLEWSCVVEHREAMLVGKPMPCRQGCSCSGNEISASQSRVPSNIELRLHATAFASTTASLQTTKLSKTLMKANHAGSVGRGIINSTSSVEIT